MARLQLVCRAGNLCPYTQHCPHSADHTAQARRVTGRLTSFRWAAARPWPLRPRQHTASLGGMSHSTSSPQLQGRGGWGRLLALSQIRCPSPQEPLGSQEPECPRASPGPQPCAVSTDEHLTVCRVLCSSFITSPSQILTVSRARLFYLHFPSKFSLVFSKRYHWQILPSSQRIGKNTAKQKKTPPPFILTPMHLRQRGWRQVYPVKALRLLLMETPPEFNNTYAEGELHGELNWFHTLEQNCGIWE